MDLDDVRRKRIKLFGVQNTIQDNAASPSTPQSSKMAARGHYPDPTQGHQDPRQQIGFAPATGAALNAPPDISEDEKFARQLQAEIEAEERPASKGSFHLPSHVADGLTGDEWLANSLHEQFDHSYPYGSTFEGDTYGRAQSSNAITDDEKIARELQAHFDSFADDDVDSEALAKSRSITPKAAVELPPTPPTNTIMGQKLDDSTDAVAVRKFVSRILGIKCAVCTASINLDPATLVNQFATYINDNPGAFASPFDAIFLLQCKACAAKTCPGCAKAVTSTGNAYGNTASSGKSATWHCDLGRLALIWLTLCGYDNAAAHNKVTDNLPRKPQQSDYDRLGIGYGIRGRPKKTSATGIGYDSGSYYDGYDVYEDEEDPTAQTLSGQPAPPPSAPLSTFGSAPHPYALPGHMLGGNTIGGYQVQSSAPMAPGISSQLSAPAPPPGLGTGGPYGKSPSPYPAPPSQPPVIPFVKPKDFGYGQSGTAGSKGHRKRKVKGRKPSAVDPDVDLTTNIMSLLAAILPSAHQPVPTQFDLEPPRVLASMLKRSSILDRAATLLRNDSVEAAKQRFNLYGALMHFVPTLTLIKRSGSTSSILFEELHLNKAGHDLLKVSFSMPTRLEGEEIETSQSLAVSMEHLIAQSKAMLSLMQRNGDTESEEEQAILMLCTIISDCADKIAKQGTEHNPIDVDMDPPPANKDEWQTSLRVLPVADEIIMDQHYYKTDAQALLTALPPRRRTAHIFRELVSLQTSLPDGIFIRHGETRPDVMKILIIGPEDTPYAHGVWEFDLICPLQYPNVSPQMQLRTNGGGKVGFNPNLYADGKVCLSLLGTWSGQGWISGTSTLLQVLVSIQAMIFIDEPWANEPGRENQRDTDQSKAYNRRLYPDVVKYAMLEWIEGKRTKTGGPAVSYRGLGRTIGDTIDPRKSKNTGSEGIWSEVTKKHFEINHDAIVDTVIKWTQDKPPANRAQSRYSKPAPDPYAMPNLHVSPNANPLSYGYGVQSAYGFGGPPSNINSGGNFGGPAYGSPVKSKGPFAASGQYGMSFTGPGRTIGGEQAAVGDAKSQADPKKKKSYVATSLQGPPNPYGNPFAPPSNVVGNQQGVFGSGPASKPVGGFKHNHSLRFHGWQQQEQQLAPQQHQQLAQQQQQHQLMLQTQQLAQHQQMLQQPQPGMQQAQTSYPTRPPAKPKPVKSDPKIKQFNFDPKMDLADKLRTLLKSLQSGSKGYNDYLE